MEYATHEQLRQATKEFIDPFIANIGRVHSMILQHRILKMAQTLPRLEPSDLGDPDDVLRGAVVFLHSTLEESLREYALHLLPLASAEALDAIPFAGLKGRPEKVLLGRLASHRGKLVDDLISESVKQYLDTSNFNNPKDIANLLQQLGVDAAAAAPFYPAIGNMMSRRHLIVHRGDRATAGEKGSLSEIATEEVRRWMVAIVEFFQAISGPTVARILVERGVKFSPNLLSALNKPDSTEVPEDFS